MKFTVLNTDFEAIAVVDSYTSAIWTVRYNSSGDFEIQTPVDLYLLDVLKEDYYLITSESDRAMIISDIEIKTDQEEGPIMTITGKSLEQILDRRIVLNKTSFEATYNSQNNATLPNLQNGIKQLIQTNIITPLDDARRIPNFIFKESTDPAITSLTFEAQYYGEDLYEVISKLCQEKKIGFKILLTDNNEFEFELYAGVDRSYKQFLNPYVIFSPDYGNLRNSNYYRSKSAYKNVAVVAGEVEDAINEDTEIRTVITVGNESGLNRREIFANANDISHKLDDGTELSDLQYEAHLKKRGIDTLIDNLDVEAFDGDVDTTTMYKYGEDFFLGDIVQVVNEYGHEGRSCVSEFIISNDTEGINIYPTFVTLQEGEYDHE